MQRGISKLEYRFKTQTVYTEDVIIQMEYDMLKDTKATWIFFAAYLFMIITAPILPILRHDPVGTAAGGFLAVFVPLFFNFVLRKGAVWRLRKDSFLYGRNFEYLFFEDHMEERCDINTTQLPYKTLEKVIEGKQNFYLLTDSGRLFIILKSACTPGLIEFLEKLKQNR